ncbi:hypothetical protein B0H17DRAFT_1332629 [Mycena rosella]|uniref:Uncharacterized protein n=1 Tax=Mycena rosella TaxID=1033263 RepID=A0AAD7DAR1_MYCRO|nr:hypothetical protein B0H17DRAFT_1332629 [Mycena rosella]
MDRKLDSVYVPLLSSCPSHPLATARGYRKDLSSDNHSELIQLCDDLVYVGADAWMDIEGLHERNCSFDTPVPILPPNVLDDLSSAYIFSCDTTLKASITPNTISTPPLVLNVLGPLCQDVRVRATEVAMSWKAVGDELQLHLRHALRMPWGLEWMLNVGYALSPDCVPSRRMRLLADLPRTIAHAQQHVRRLGNLYVTLKVPCVGA